jgi:sulfonate transport system substrate-binding protein
MMDGLRIGGVPEHFNYPWRMGIESSLFRKQGLELHWSDMTGGTGQMIRGLQTGSLDVAVLLSEGIIQSIHDGLPASILQFYVQSPLVWGVHVANDCPTFDISTSSKRRFAVSRMGSGSHLMAYLLADQYNWEMNSLSFEIVGDLYGGLWSLANNTADFFLWEKYTTQPFVDQRKCQRMDVIQTPWPCFVIAARNQVIKEKSDALRTLCQIIREIVRDVMDDPLSPSQIAWRYHLDESDTRSWFAETKWTLDTLDQSEVVHDISHTLFRLGLLGDNERLGKHIFLNY